MPGWPIGRSSGATSSTTPPAPDSVPDTPLPDPVERPDLGPAPRILLRASAATRIGPRLQLRSDRIDGSASRQGATYCASRLQDLVVARQLPSRVMSRDRPSADTGVAGDCESGRPGRQALVAESRRCAVVARAFGPRSLRRLSTTSLPLPPRREFHQRFRESDSDDRDGDRVLSQLEESQARRQPELVHLKARGALDDRTEGRARLADVTE